MVIFTSILTPRLNEIPSFSGATISTPWYSVARQKVYNACVTTRLYTTRRSSSRKQPFDTEYASMLKIEWNDVRGKNRKRGHGKEGHMDPFFSSDVRLSLTAFGDTVSCGPFPNDIPLFSPALPNLLPLSIPPRNYTRLFHPHCVHFFSFSLSSSPYLTFIKIDRIKIDLSTFNHQPRAFGSAFFSQAPVSRCVETKPNRLATAFEFSRKVFFFFFFTKNIFAMMYLNIIQTCT